RFCRDLQRLTGRYSKARDRYLHLRHIMALKGNHMSRHSVRNMTLAIALAASTLPAFASDMNNALGGGLGGVAGAAVGGGLGGSTGAVIGGAVGGGAGGAVTSNRRERTGAIIGGALGGGAGTAAGNAMGGRAGGLVGAAVGGGAGAALGGNMSRSNSYD